MNHKIFYALMVFVFGLMLCGPFVLSANAAPVISGIQPTKVAPGELVAVIGSDLSGTVDLLLNTGTTYSTNGTFSSSKNEYSFKVPDNLPAGNYRVRIQSASGAAESSMQFTVVSGGKSFRSSPTIRIPTEGLPGFGQLIAMIFTWSLNILGIVVFVMIFFAGFKWFTAAGNTAKVNEARSQITNAITGAIILLAAYIILYTINPDLVGGTFTLPGVGSSTQQAP